MTGWQAGSDGRWVQVGCAGRWVPAREVIVAAAVATPGVSSMRVPWNRPETARTVALAMAAVLGLRLMLTTEFRRVELLLPAPLELAARLRTGAHLPELDPRWREELNRAHRALQIRVLSTAPGIAPQLQQTAEIVCAAAVDPTHSTNGHAPR